MKIFLTNKNLFFNNFMYLSVDISFGTYGRTCPCFSLYFTTKG